MIPLLLTALLITSSPLSVATTDDALATLANPAGLGVGHDFNMYYFYNFVEDDFWHNQTFAMQASNFGFSYIDFTEYRLGMGSKVTNGVYLGTTYRRVSNKNFWDVGILIRPHQYISLGAVVQSIGKKVNNQVITGIALRPFTNRLTLTCDFYSSDWKKPSMGLETEPLNGIDIKGKINTDGVFSIQAAVGLDKIGLGTLLNSSTENIASKKWAGFARFNSENRRSIIKPKPKFLELTLTGAIADQKSGFSLLGSSADYTTYEILSIIQNARKDKSIKGIILKLQNPQMSFAIAQEIKSALDEFKKENKKLIVYAPNLGNTGYYLACGADQIITHPLGEIVIPGIAVRQMFLKGTLEKLGLEADYERIGKHKDAPEMLTQDTMSLSSREVINSILDDYYENIITTVASSRGFTKEEIESKINQGFFMAKEAQENKLVDYLCYEDELDSILKADNKGYVKITSARYNRQKDYIYNWLDLANICVIYANGDITQGESSVDLLMGGNTCGANTMVREIREARKDDDVKAIILRVDSPGGDGFASDLIFREVALAKKDKPVIVSMGPVAASGGYYISMAADKIFVLPATITGSIGAFSMKFVTQNMYDKLGITHETIKRGEHADAFSQDRKFNDSEREMLQRQLKDFYGQFIGKVAQYRNLTTEYVDSVGQGRVWTGNQAQQNKLADSLGGLLDAIDYAKEKANVKEVKIDFKPSVQRNFLNMTWALISTLIKIMP